MIFVPWFNLPYLVPWHKAGTRYPEASMKKAWHMAICHPILSFPAISTKVPRLPTITHALYLGRSYSTCRLWAMGLVGD